MKKQIILLAVAALTLSSCGIYTKYEPATEVPEDLFGEKVITTIDSLDNIGNLNWRELFTDPQLQKLIENGLQNNTDLQVAQLRVEQAGANLKAAKLAYLPSFNLDLQGTVSSFDNSKATQTYSLPVAASWEIDVFGRLTNAKGQARASHLQSQEYRQAVQCQLIAGIANTYYTLLMLDTQLAIAESTEQSWKNTVEATRALKDAGQTTEAGVSQIEATYYNICNSILDLKEQLNATENSMSLLLAETPHTIERGKMEGQVLPVSLSVGIPMEMLANRPDVRSAEYALEQAFYGTNMARSAFYPSIVLGGNAGWTNSAGGMITNPGKFLASAVGSITQPLFNRGQLNAQLRIAKAQQEEAELSFHQTLLNAGSEVNNAIVQYQTAQEKSVNFDKQVNALSRALESTTLLMQYGDVNYLEVLTAQQSLLNAQLTQVANRFTETQSVINLYQALGGGRN